MGPYLIDTNVISDYFSASIPAAGLQFMDAVIDAIPNLSIIIQIELLCWTIDADTEKKIAGFISESLVLDITPDVIVQCVSLRKGKSKKIKTPDAIIAATALAHSYTLITNNEKDFVGIQGLNIVNPHKV